MIKRIISLCLVFCMTAPLMAIPLCVTLSYRKKAAEREAQTALEQCDQQMYTLWTIEAEGYHSAMVAEGCVPAR